MTSSFDSQEYLLEAMEANDWEVSEDETKARRKGGEWMPIAEASAAFQVWHKDNWEPPDDSDAWSGAFADNH